MKSKHILFKNGRHFYISNIIILIVLLSGLFSTTIFGQSDVTENNKKLVSDFWLMIPSDVDMAFRKYAGETYIQHDPAYPDGKEGTIKFIKKHLAAMSEASGRIIRVIAEDDLVALHVLTKANPDDPGDVGVELFRVEGGKIVEHWSVFQKIPEESLNSNTMY